MMMFIDVVYIACRISRNMRLIKIEKHFFSGGNEKNSPSERSVIIRALNENLSEEIHLRFSFSVEPPERFVDEFKAPFSQKKPPENLLAFTFKDNAENELTTFPPCVAVMSLERMKRNNVSSHNKTFNSLVASFFRDPPTSINLN